MNKILFIVALFFVSCGNKNTKPVYDGKSHIPMTVKTNDYSYYVSEWEHKGHVYLIVERSHGSGITHAGHCPCNTGK